MSLIDGHAPVRARRTYSLPPKYMIPSEDIGEYESPMRRKSAPEREKPPGTNNDDHIKTYFLPQRKALLNNEKLWFEPLLNFSPFAY